MRRLADVRKWLLAIALVVPGLACRAVARVSEFLPEIDGCYKVTDELRVWMQAKETYEAGDPVTAEFGPSLDFYLKPMVRLENTTFDLDDSKSRPLVFSIGYRYLPYPSSPLTNRMEPIVTFNFLVPKLGLSPIATAATSIGRMAALPGVTGIACSGTQRQNKLLPFAAYVRAEFFYESQYRKWADTAIYLGCLFPIGKHVEINPYYEHQNQQKPRSAVQPVRLDREPLLRPTIADGISLGWVKHR